MYLRDGEEREPPTYTNYCHYYAPELLDVTEKYLSLQEGSENMQVFLEEQWRKRKAVVNVTIILLRRIAIYYHDHNSMEVNSATGCVGIMLNSGRAIKFDNSY